MPKVSVIMGVYNGSKGIENAVKSILNQTFTDFEFIICDDGSTDNSFNLIKKLALEDSRIKMLTNKENLKLAGTLNRCLKVAKGEYIARMDDDDLAHPTRFEKQVEFLDENLNYAILGTSRNLYDDDGIWGSHIIEGQRNKNNIFLGETFVHPSVMMRRIPVLEVGGYSESTDIGRTEDYDLWCKLYEKGYKGYNLADILLDYYEGRDSYKKRQYKYRVAEYRLKKKWYKRLGISNKYSLYVYRPLIVGLLPTRILMKYHKYIFSNKNS